MANWKKLAMGAAGAAGGGEALNVEDVFSTYLYNGTNAAQTITNGIALADGVGGGTSTEFDGSSDYLLRTTDFSNTQGSKTFTLSFWVYDNIGEAGTSRAIYYIFDGSTYYSFQVYFLSSDGYLRIRGRNSSGTVILDQKITTVVRKKDQWLHVLMSFDLSDSSKRHYAVNDVVGTPSNTTYTNDTIAFSNGSPQHSIAGSFTGGTLHDGNLAHFYMDYTYRDLTVASNRRLFIDANGGSTSASTLSALNPVIYLPMTDGYSVGENIGTGGDLTAYGSPTIVDSGTEYLSGYGQGGLVWMKARSGTGNHLLYDTERGPYKSVRTNQTNAENTASTGYGLEAFNTDGFNLGLDWGGENWATDIASWTFRKAPKFFDVVTYTGNGTAGREISHNLGTTVGTIIVKRLNAGTNWGIYHRSNTSSPEGQVLEFDTGATTSNTTIWNNTAPTSTVFTVGNSPYSNFNGSTYVAYLFAHNDGDGGFGPNGDADIIKCGSFTGNGSSDGQFIDLGFEPQWLLVKKTSAADNWILMDNMRGMVTSSPVYNNDDETLKPNTSGAELTSNDISSINPTGFTIREGGNSLNSISATYIYIAIRRGPMAVPESADEVFKAAYGNASGEPAFTSGFPADFGIWHGTISSSNENRTSTRLTQGKTLDTDSTAAEQTSTAWAFDYQDGFMSGGGGSSNFATMWRRAPNFFDVVAYTGTGSARTIDHNLGVAPEMIWVKRRNGIGNWRVAIPSLYPSNGLLALDSTGAASSLDNNNFGDASNNYYEPTASDFGVGTNVATNASGSTYIAYLFASLDGVSKVGSYTGNSTTASDVQNIDCGFSSGARFVLIKRTDSTGNWWFFDTERGITTGATDPVLNLDTTTAEYTETAMFGRNVIQPYSSGFGVSSGAFNYTGYEYIFYAIA